MPKISTTRATIIGFGLIGKALKARVEAQSDWELARIIDRGKVLDGQGKKIEDFDPAKPNLEKFIPKDTSVVFLAIPTTDDGAIAYSYIRHCIERKIPIVTCEKGALSHYHRELKKHLRLNQVGYSATVGGGTRMLTYLRERIHRSQEIVVHSVINGTLNYIFDEIASAGRSYGNAVEEAQRLGYAEPGAKDALQVLNGEIRDTVMKATILFNVCFDADVIMHPRDVKIRLLTAENLTTLISEGLDRRYIVSFLPEGTEAPSSVIGGFTAHIEGWKIVAGFQRTDTNSLFRSWLPKGVNNSILAYEGRFGEDGIYTLTGPGAGAKPTTASMMTDARLLLGQQ